MRGERLAAALVAMRDVVFGGLLAGGASPGEVVGRFERGEYGWSEVRVMFEAMAPMTEIHGVTEEPLVTRRRLRLEEPEAAWEAVRDGEWGIPGLDGGDA